MKKIRRGVLACTLTGLAAPAFSQSLPNEYNLEIEPLPLVAALKEFSRQTGLQVGYLPEDRVQERTTAAELQGKYTVEAALSELLAPSGLSFQRINARTIAVTPPDADTLSSHHRSTWQGETQNKPALQLLKLLDQAPDESNIGPRLEHTLAVLAEGPLADRKSAENGQRAEDFDANDDVEEVVVTGTHIRGTGPIGSQLIVIDRSEIEASGYGRLQDLIEHLPQNFSGSTSEDNFGEFGARNYTRGQAIDLRGLGASSTLILVNGRRQPAGGTEGSFVDISSLAASAIERIEVVADGASAIYGADAIGGVVNFITRKDYEGFETNVRLATTGEAAGELQASLLAGKTWKGGNLLVGYQYMDRDALMASDAAYASMNQDYRPLGGSDFRAPYSNPGTILDPVTRLPAYAIPAGQDGTNLTTGDLALGQNYWDNVTGLASLPSQVHHSAFFSLSHDAGTAVEFFADGRYSRREMFFPTVDYPAQVSVPSTNPFYVNPFGGTEPVRVAYAFAKDLGGPTTETGDTQTYTLTVGAIGRLTEQWRLNLASTYGRERNSYVLRNAVSSSAVVEALADPNPETALNVFGDGPHTNPRTIDLIRSGLRAQGTTSVTSVTAIVDGPLVALPAGSMTLALGADYRNEDLVTSSSFLPAPGSLTRHVLAAFGEAIVPIVSRGAGTSGYPNVHLSLAARYEDYSDFGSTLNPKVGINIEPVDGVQLRGSWGTSFRAPRFNQISTVSNPSAAFALIAIPDPQSSNGFSDALVLTGNNPDLREETADIWTAGFEIRPAGLSELAMSATYFSLDYADKIQLGGSGRNTLLREAEWAGIITRNPTRGQIDAVCNSASFVGICPSAPAVILDHRLRNLAGVRVRGIDFQTRYHAARRRGDVELGLAGTYTLKYERAVTSIAPSVDVLDTVGNPLALRIRGTIGCSINNWKMHIAVNYAGAYDDPARSRDVDSWITLDASALYEFTGESWLDGTSIQLSAVNVLNKEPPFVNQPIGFDPANANQLGRWIGLSITRRW